MTLVSFIGLAKQGANVLPFIKKFAPVVLLALSSSVIAAPPANAEYEGCPETWTLKTGSSGSDISQPNFDPSLYQQLTDIQKLRGASNMTINRLSSYSVISFAGKSGPVDEKVLKELPWGPVSSSLQYLYGESVVEETYIVEVRGCAGTSSFVNKRPFAPSISFIHSTSEEWVKQNQSIFKDFKEEQDFLAHLTLVQEKIKREAALGAKLQNGRQIPLIGSFNFKQFPAMSLEIVPQSPNCVRPLNDRYLNLELGRLCSFAFSINNRTVSRDIFGSFEVDGRPVLSEIICVKGKISKKVKAVKPVCPSGYKKK